MNDVFTAMTSPGARRNPYEAAARFRRSGPVVDSGLGAWFVFSHAECLAVLRDRRTSVDERNATLAGPGDRLPTLIHLDPPDHERLRRLVQVAFTPRRVALIRERAAELIDETLDRFQPDEEVDLIGELAYPMPLTIICDLLGVDLEDRELVRDWSTWLARSIDPGVLRTDELNARINHAQDEFVTFMHKLVNTRRQSPREDLLSQLVMLEMDGDRLDADELVGLALLLLVAGHETTVGLIGNAVDALLRFPEQLALLHAGKADARRAVDEFLRFDSPVQMTTRIALEPLSIHETTIPKGGIIVVMLGAANRDPSAFHDPDRLDLGIERSNTHLAFGNGIHHCLGAALARAEGEVAIARLVHRFPNLKLVKEPIIRPTFVLRGREELRVTLGPATI